MRFFYFSIQQKGDEYHGHEYGGRSGAIFQRQTKGMQILLFLASEKEMLQLG